ncbi:hypothetical protein ABG067_001011 [Albugo candida]
MVTAQFCTVTAWSYGGAKATKVTASVDEKHDKARAKSAILRGSLQAKSSGYCYNVRTLWSVVTAKIGAAQPFKLRGNPLFDFLLDGRQIGQVLNL